MVQEHLYLLVVHQVQVLQWRHWFPGVQVHLAVQMDLLVLFLLVDLVHHVHLVHPLVRLVLCEDIRYVEHLSILTIFFSKGSPSSFKIHLH